MAKNITSFGKDSRPYSAREDQLILAMKYGDGAELAAQLGRTVRSIISRKGKLRGKYVAKKTARELEEELAKKFDTIIAGRKTKRMIITPFARPAFFNEDIKTLARVSGNKILNGTKDRAHAALSFSKNSDLT